MPQSGQTNSVTIRGARGFGLPGLPVIVGKKNVFAVCMALTVVAGPIRVPLFFFAVKRLVADGAGKLRRDGLFTGSAGFAVVVRKKGVAVGIGASPEESPVFLVRTLAPWPCRTSDMGKRWEGG